MKPHQEKFYEIEKILKREFNSLLLTTIENEDIYLEIDQSNFWIKCNEIELTVGFGELHGHYSDEYENLELGIKHIFNLLSNKIRITDYKKGKIIYKSIGIIEFENSKSEEFGSSLTMFYPFLKKTEVKTYYYNKLIEPNKIDIEFQKLYKKNAG